ncbi:hypothetical protein [Anaerovorax sp. IOR16]|uniref:hypothetical protein n=1 Tax=Anaerovorax sp. IOR16 TaxID=2773458 RepID=UPI0019CFAB25|nr:hypothetical protein [Anaerovorax sp. IOR16]
MEQFYNKHYIVIDDKNRIIDGFSDAFKVPSDTDICINEQGGYQFRLFVDGKANPSLYDEYGVPKYKYIDGAVIERTAEEMEADRPVITPQPTDIERIMELENVIAELIKGGA